MAHIPRGVAKYLQLLFTAVLRRPSVINSRSPALFRLWLPRYTAPVFILKSVAGCPRNCEAKLNAGSPVSAHGRIRAARKSKGACPLIFADLGRRIRRRFRANTTSPWLLCRGSSGYIRSLLVARGSSIPGGEVGWLRGKGKVSTWAEHFLKIYYAAP